ncbi:MAG: hypothetical protein E7051_07875 [Lentisphaerae bacterium]|nr:hypothetical protein [Lentisphaerota bacterium]
MKKFFIMFCLAPLMMTAAETGLRIFRLSAPGKYEKIYETKRLEAGRVALGENTTVEISTKAAGKLTEYTFNTANSGTAVAKLRFQLFMPVPADGVFWDGYEYFTNVTRTVAPKHDMHNYPGASYVAEKKNLCFLGVAPWTVSSRFERALQVGKEGAELQFEHYTAVLPQEKIKSGLISGFFPDGRRNVEAIEAVHNAYADFFRPVKGADERIYGAGGYFFGSNATREQQIESARKEGLSWEWYYNCFQHSGDIFPSEEFWQKEKGYKTEISHNRCDVPGTVQDWLKYNRDRVKNAQRTTATFYYYIQQHCCEDILFAKYPDSQWVRKDRKSAYRAHGWAEEGWSRYAWPGKYGSYGKALREDLAKVWNNLDVSGFALDCAIGNLRCYDKPAMNEEARAFEDDGDIFIREGAAVAYNLQFTRSLPPRPDGRRAASVLNEHYNYLPAFYADAAIHEMPPFERTELLAPRKFMLGQKPFYFWKGFRIDSLLAWEKGREVVMPALNGIVDYVIMASLRFGAVPAVFYNRGFADIARWNPAFAYLQKLGWRAAPYAEIAGTDEADPYSGKAKYWISRFGDGENSVIAVSCTDKKAHKAVLEIETGKFGADGAIYASTDGRVFRNKIEKGRTLVEIELADHHPVILKKIGTDKPVPKYYIAHIRPAGMGVDGDGKGQESRYYWKNRVIKTVPAPVKFDAMAIYKLDFGVDPLKCALVSLPGEGEKVEPGRDQLAVYFEYFRTRRRYSYPRLWALEKRWVKNMRMRKLDISEAEKAPETLLFAIGESARKHFFGEEKFTDEIAIKQVNGKTVVGFFPGKKSENEIMQKFLKLLDRRFPHYGGISDRWALNIKFYGATLDNGRTPEKPKKQ